MHHETIRNNRNSNVEFLRFFLMICVCIIHLFFHGLDLKNPEQADILYKDLVILSLIIPSVNCFMFISGYYGIQCKNEKLLRLVLQAFLFYIATVLFRCILGSTLNFVDIFKHVFPASSKAWWFLTEYITIMLLSPLVNEGIKKISKKNFFHVLLSLGFINCIGLYMSNNHTGSDLLGLLFVYLVARYIRLFHDNISLKKAFFIWLASTLLLVCLLCIPHFFNKNLLIKYVLYYCNPLIIAQAIGLFFICTSFKKQLPSYVNWLGKHCFAIYLFTERSSFYFYKKWATLYRQDSYILLILSILSVAFAIMMFDCVINIIIKNVICSNKCAYKENS